MKRAKALAIKRANAKCQRFLHARPEKFKSMVQIPEGVYQCRLHEGVQMTRSQGTGHGKSKSVMVKRTAYP